MTGNVREIFYRKVLDNRAFTVSETFSVADGGTANIHLKNPSGSGSTLVLIDLEVSGDGGFTARLHDEFSSAPSGGTSVEIQATFLDSDGTDDDGVATANKNVSFTNGVATFAALGGGAGASSVGGQQTLPTMAMDEGREIVIEVENTTASSHTYSITTVYFEKD